jgi:hypothetical protein
MNTTWHTEDDRLACRWSELPQRVPYNPGWMQEGTTIGAEPPAPYFLDFSRFSGLGGRRWFEWRSFEPNPGDGC